MTAPARSFLTELLGGKLTTKQIILLARYSGAIQNEAWRKMLTLVHAFTLTEVIALLKDMGDRQLQQAIREPPFGDGLMEAIDSEGRSVKFWMAFMEAFPRTTLATCAVEKMQSRCTIPQLVKILSRDQWPVVRMMVWTELKSRKPSPEVLITIIRKNHFLRVDALKYFKEVGYDPKQLASLKKLPEVSHRIGRLLKGKPMNRWES